LLGPNFLEHFSAIKRLSIIIVSNFNIIIIAIRLVLENGIILVVRVELSLATHSVGETITMVPKSLISTNIQVTILEGSFPVALE